MKKTALLLILLTILTKLIGFFREIILSYYYGASATSDAYLISLTIPTVIFTLIGVGIQTTYIPMYNKVLNQYGENEANTFTNNFINVLILTSIALIIPVFIFTENVVKIFASGFNIETLLLATHLTKISIFSILIIGMLYVFQGYLQIKNNFIIPALIGLPLNFFLILSIILSTHMDISVLGYGRVLASLGQLIFILPFMYKEGYMYSAFLSISDENLKKAIYLSIPVMIGTSVNQINMLVDRTIASRVASGGISALNYAFGLNNFIQGVFIMSISTVLFASISKMAVVNNIDELKKATKGALIGISILIIPATLGVLIFANPIVEVIFSRGAFEIQATIMTSSALFYYSIGMLGFGYREVLSRVLYSMQDTKTPITNASIGMGVNIILNIILSQLIGIGGLALATSISAILTAILMYISVRKKIGPFGMKQISISFLKILFASLVMGGLAKLSFNYLTVSLSQNLSLLIAISVGALSYFVIIYFMKIEDVDVIVGAIKKKLGRGAV